MKQDAEAHAEEDKNKQELIEVRNVADQMIYTAEKAIKDHGEAAGADLVKAVEEKVVALKEAKDKEDKTAITSATENLSNEMQKIGELIQKAAESETKQDDTNETVDGNDNVRDAEVTEKEPEPEDKKE